MTSLQQWAGQQFSRAALGMLRSVSAVDILKTRPGFAQTVRPVKGSILASPAPASYDPDPDYFFHWFRDSAVVIDALRLLYCAGGIGAEALEHLADFVRFSLGILRLDGRRHAGADWRSRVTPEFSKFLRTEADLAAVHGASVAAETRVNPDGTLDISSWPRPQYDGPAMRAVALLRWLDGVPLPADLTAAVAELVRFDLEFVAAHCREPSFDIWEEERGRHYYTIRIAAAALDGGGAWLERRSEPAQADRYRREAAALSAQLDDFWLEERGFYRSRFLPDGQLSKKELDIAVILAAVHSASVAAKHSARDPRMHATLARLEHLFDAAYPINRGRTPDRGPAMGRYAGDVYYSGGAYYFSTLGAAEFCYQAAGARDADARAWVQRGDRFLETVRAFTPASGELSEQFDQRSGVQTSARHLAWSYACFISCVCARRAVAP